MCAPVLPGILDFLCRDYHNLITPAIAYESDNRSYLGIRQETHSGHQPHHVIVITFLMTQPAIEHCLDKQAFVSQ